MTAAYGRMTGDEIRRRMLARGLKPKDLAEALNLDPPKISKIFSGERQVKAPEMDILRRLLAGDIAQLPGIPIIGQSAAGNWKLAVQRAGASIPQPDPSIPSRAFALKVDGDSMDLLVDDGGTIIIDPDDKNLFPGRYYVVLNSEGETTFKQFKADPARLVPCSSNPAHTDIMLGIDKDYDVVGRVIWRASRM